MASMATPLLTPIKPWPCYVYEHMWGRGCVSMLAIAGLLIVLLCVFQKVATSKLHDSALQDAVNAEYGIANELVKTYTTVRPGPPRCPNDDLTITNTRGTLLWWYRRTTRSTFRQCQSHQRFPS